jgi:hypothetical protein
MAWGAPPPHDGRVHAPGRTDLAVASISVVGQSRTADFGIAREFPTCGLTPPGDSFDWHVRTGRARFGGLEKDDLQRTLNAPFGRAAIRGRSAARRPDCHVSEPRRGGGEHAGVGDWRRERNWDPTFSTCTRVLGRIWKRGPVGGIWAPHNKSLPEPAAGAIRASSTRHGCSASRLVSKTGSFFSARALCGGGR